jgi:hypothetical protein
LLKNSAFLRKHLFFTFALLTIISIAAPLVSCSSLELPSISTPLPIEYLPTAAALTLSASGVLNPPLPEVSKQASDIVNNDLPNTQPPVSATSIINSASQLKPETTLLPTIKPPEPPSAPSSQTIPPALTTSIDPIMPTNNPSAKAVTPTTGMFATFTPAPPIPEATIQILQLGDLSKVLSPIPISTRLTCGQGKTIRFELYGEDGRLLARYMRTYENIPWNTARIGFDMEFEISAAAELGRLVVSAEDSLGRLIEASSMDLVLMSQGMSEINPPTGLQQRIIIHDPTEKSLIQSGKLIVSGRAKPATNQPLRAMLVGEDGKILGQRLAGIVTPIPGDYGTFIAEVPYSVTAVTPALLMVFEEGGPISPYKYLTSIQVMLAP